jgi:hypothetical protein
VRQSVLLRVPRPLRGLLLYLRNTLCRPRSCCARNMPAACQPKVQPVCSWARRIAKRWRHSWRAGYSQPHHIRHRIRTMQNTTHSIAGTGTWSRFSERFLKLFHAYAGWLVSITWGRFLFLALVLLISMGIIHDQPPLNWTYWEELEPEVAPPKPPRPPVELNRPSSRPPTRAASRPR